MDLANLFETLGTLNVRPGECKVHFAKPHGQSDPLKLSRGEFEEWQSFQRQQNFTRAFVVALISGEGSNCWHFRGVYEVRGEPKRADESHRSRARELKIPADWVAKKLEWVYAMHPLTVPDELEDTTVCFPKNRVGPNPYLFADKLLKRLRR